MEHKQTSPSMVGLSRRDFLKILSVGGGTVLLAGCGVRPQPSVSPTYSISMPSNTPISPVSTRTFPPHPSPTFTSSQTFEPAPGYLPAADSMIKNLTLPPPQFPGSMPLFNALQQRHSSRNFRLEELSLQVLSTLLWSGFGVNRPDGKRTAPSAYNVRDIDIFLVTGKGLYQYKADDHSLTGILPADLRIFTGSQGFAASAPLDLVYVSDYSKMNANDEERMQWSWAHTGFIAQNLYLACAALGLVTVVRSTINRSELSRRMELQKNQHITLAQTLGYPTN